MKVYALPADVHGCGHYRIAWPADCLKQQGFDVTVLPPKEKSGFLASVGTKEDGTEVLTSVHIPHDADIIVLQRPAHKLQPQMISLMRANGIAVVVDMDDDMSSIHPGNGAYWAYTGRKDPSISWRNAIESCKVATLVTTSTRSLQGIYARHGRGEVLDNYVPEAYLDLPGEDPGTFGWAGTTASHPDDLQMLGTSVRDLVAQGHEFRVVGDGRGVRAILRLAEEPPATGMVKLVDWASSIATELGVGLVPLAATSFNTSKSRLKGIEMMATGTPWISSPREEYRRLHRESGCGELADTPKQWTQAIKKLLINEALREEQAAAGRSYMATQTYQANAWRWAAAWQRAYDIQRGVSK